MPAPVTCCQYYPAYEREKPYEEVLAEPAKVVAQRHGVSDVAPAKTCRRIRWGNMR